MSTPRTPRSILITGASSGIGAALAACYATPGVTLFLSGRDTGRLEAVSRTCRDKGATVEWRCFDITDKAAMVDWIQHLRTRSHAIDLVIANAGISGGTAGVGDLAAETYRIIDVNVSGVLHTVLPVIPVLQGQGHGQIALISSIAGLRGLPGCPAYSASKAAVKVWGEALRGYLRPWNIGVTVVLPGYIRTPMTAVNTFPMPFLMEVIPAARLIQRRLRANPPRIAFPALLYYPVYWLSCLSPHLTDFIFNRLPAKPSLQSEAHISHK